MKRMLTLLLISMPSFNTYGAESVCVYGAGINYEGGNYSYMTGAGPDGAVPNPITPLSKEVAESLEEASKGMKTNEKFCMEGTFLKVADGEYSFMVYQAKKELH